FGGVLALEPDNAEAKGRVDRIRRRAKLLKLGRRALIGGAAAAIAAAVSVPAIRFFERVQAARDERDRQETRANELRAAVAAGTRGALSSGQAGAPSGEVPSSGGRDSTPGSAERGTAPTSARNRDRSQEIGRAHV